MSILIKRFFFTSCLGTQVEITNYDLKVQTENKPINELCCKNPLYETTLLGSNDQKVTEFVLELPITVSETSTFF